MSKTAALRLVIVMLLWAGCFPLIALGLGSAPHLAFASMRAVIAGACLLGLGTLLGRPLPSDLRTWAWLLLVGFGTTTLGFLGMFHAAEFVAPGVATVIANAQPLLAAILAHVFLAERLGRRGGLGLAVGFVGIIAIAWPGMVASTTENYALGIAYIGLAAAGVAIGYVVMKRIAGQVDAIMAMGVQLLLGGVPLAILSLSTEDLSTIDWSWQFVTALVLLAVFVTALAFWLWFVALQEVTLSKANAFTFLVPLFGLAIGATFFDERLGWSSLVGSALVVIGIVFVQQNDRGRSNRILADREEPSRARDIAVGVPSRADAFNTRPVRRNPGGPP